MRVGDDWKVRPVDGEVGQRILDRVARLSEHVWRTVTATVSRALLPAVMVPPLTYGLFAFVHGELTGFYAYFFLDLPAQGPLGFVIANLVLAAFFAAVGAGLLAGKNALARKRAA